MSFYIFAETAFHHEGDKDYLKSLVQEAKKAGVDGIKFQVLIELNNLMSEKHSSYEQAEKWLLSLDDWREVFKYTEDLGLDIILMPVDIKAFELVESFNIKFIEIHSVSFKDKKLFSMMEFNNIPLVLGIGGRTLDEINEVVDTYSDRDITLMVGFQSFPSELEDIKIGRIKELVNMYPNCTIGYADHSSYDDEMAVISNEYAYILGARVFEKHLTLDEGKERIDFQSAVGFEKLTSIRLKLAFLDKILNIEDTALFDMNEKEMAYRNRQKIPVAKYDLEPGHVLSSGDVVLKMLDQEEAIENIDELVGKKIIKNVNVDSAFDKKDLQ